MLIRMMDTIPLPLQPSVMRTRVIHQKRISSTKDQIQPSDLQHREIPLGFVHQLLLISPS